MLNAKENRLVFQQLAVSRSMVIPEGVELELVILDPKPDFQNGGDKYSKIQWTTIFH